MQGAGVHSIPDQGTEIPLALCPKNQNIKHWQCSKINAIMILKMSTSKKSFKNKIKLVLILKSIQTNVCHCM